MKNKYIALRGRRLIFTSSLLNSVPSGSVGLIYPLNNGFVITNKKGEEKLFVENDGTGSVCWFLAIHKKMGKRRFSPTNHDLLKEFGLEKLSYCGVMTLAKSIYEQALNKSKDLGYVPH